MQNEVAILAMPFGENRNIYFRTEFQEHRNNIPGGIVMFFRHRFIDRVFHDDDFFSTSVPPLNGRRKSWEFQCCMMVSLIVLDRSFRQHLHYEGEADNVVAPKQIAQRFAMQYGVDVQDAMQQYPSVRPFLQFEGLEIPQTLENAMRNLRLSGRTVDVRLEGI